MKYFAFVMLCALTAATLVPLTIDVFKRRQMQLPLTDHLTRAMWLLCVSSLVVAAILSRHL